MPTMREIQALPPGRLYLGNGLLIKVTPTGYRSWMYRFKKSTTGRYTEVSIGPWPEYGYSSARQVANDLYVMVLQGKDPVVEARKLETSKTTFAEAGEGWFNKRKSRWRSTRQFKTSLGKHAQPIAQLPVRSIDTPMVVKALSKLWAEHPEQGYRTSTVWASVFDYAKVMGMREGDNPAAWRGNLEHIFHRPKNHEHYRSMAFKDVPELMSRLRLRVKSTSALALQFQILTATRPGETRGMLWTEVDLVNRVWTLPPERTKQNRQHRVPLSEECVRILGVQNEYRSCDFVFPHDGEPLSPTAVDTLLRKMDVRVAPHGFRSSFRSWAAEHNIDFTLAEMCLAHSPGGATVQAYYRTDMLEQRRPIMQAWADFLG
jgi:integrase